MIKEELIRINKEFHDGSLRYSEHFLTGWDWDDTRKKDPLEIAKLVAERHPFTDGNKRTAIKFMEEATSEKVPEWVYKILEKA